MLRDWIKAHGYNRPHPRCHQATHLLLNGGCYYIPREEERTFLSEYAKDLGTPYKHYIVEKRPDIFKYMIDLDIEDSVVWGNDRILNLVGGIQSRVHNFFNGNYSVIVLVAPPRPKGEKIKTGVHLVWPRILVDSVRAQYLREQIIPHIAKVGDENMIWEDVFDGCIYTRNGFRMVGSYKPKGEPYWPLAILDRDGNRRDEYLSRMEGDYTLLVLETSIRFVPTPILTPMESLPLPTKVKGSPITRDIALSNLSSFELWLWEVLPRSYENQKVKALRRYPDGNYLVITDSRYCMNLGRNHNSCGIYFLLTRDGIYQKCLCPCDNLVDRKHGYCRDYTSRLFPLKDDVLRQELFPTKVESKYFTLGKTHSKKIKEIKNFLSSLLECDSKS